MSSPCVCHEILSYLRFGLQADLGCAGLRYGLWRSIGFRIAGFVPAHIIKMPLWMEEIKTKPRISRSSFLLMQRFS